MDDPTAPAQTASEASPVLHRPRLAAMDHARHRGRPRAPRGRSGYNAWMRSGNIPFKFDMNELLARARRQFSKHVGNVTLSLPGISIAVNPKDRERQVAREIVIRLKDRRVLSSWECCDDCIERALVSLQEIRKLLVDKQVELSDCHDGPLYLLIDAMLSGIRQFLTFEETLTQDAGARSQHREREPRAAKQNYFDALELLRNHLSHCLGQIATMAHMKVPKDSLISNYQDAWPTDAYLPPPSQS
jgi:hypothetical protein